MGGLGRDGLNLCEGAGEGIAALAKKARPSAFPPGGPEPDVQRYQGQHNLVRCPRKPRWDDMHMSSICVIRRSRSMGCAPTGTPRFLLGRYDVGRGCHCAPETQR